MFGEIRLVEQHIKKNCKTIFIEVRNEAQNGNGLIWIMQNVLELLI